SRVLEVAEYVRLDAVQLHGDESPEYCAGLDSIPLIKAFRVDGAFDPGLIAEYPLTLALLDTSIKGSYGGTGRSFDWTLALKAKAYADVMLAGGLNTLTVAEARLTGRAAAIDVCGGVAAHARRKDLDKIRTFLGLVASTNRIIEDQEDQPGASRVNERIEKKESDE